MSEEEIAIGAVMFLLGLYSGGRVERWRWERNADNIQRIESGGNLFKVYHAPNVGAGQPK